MTVSSIAPAWLSLASALLATGLLMAGASLSSEVAADPAPRHRSARALNPDQQDTGQRNTGQRELDRTDTLDVVVDAGSPVILSLPSSVRDRPVEQYRLVEPPSLASVADRSLLWVTRPENTGSHTLRILARHADPPADTLIVRVEVHDRS